MLGRARTRGEGETVAHSVKAVVDGNTQRTSYSVIDTEGQPTGISLPSESAANRIAGLLDFQEGFDLDARVAEVASRLIEERVPQIVAELVPSAKA